MQVDRTQAREVLTAGASALSGQGNLEGAAMIQAFLHTRDALGPGGASTIAALIADVRTALDD